MPSSLQLIARRLLPAALFSVALSALACGGGGSPAAPTTSTSTTTTTPSTTPSTPTTPTTPVTYAGTFAAVGYIGAFTMSGNLPAVRDSASLTPQTATLATTCTYRFSGAANTNSLSGTYDTAAQSFSCPSNVLNMTGEVQTDGTLRGGTKSSIGEGALAGGVSTSANPIKSYCGTFTSGNTGRISFTVVGTKIVGVGTDDSHAQLLSITGTLSGSTVTLTWPIGTSGSGTATGPLTVSATQTFIIGTWTTTLGEKGAWTVANGC